MFRIATLASDIRVADVRLRGKASPCTTCGCAVLGASSAALSRLLNKTRIWELVARVDSQCKLALHTHTFHVFVRLQLKMPNVSLHLLCLCMNQAGSNQACLFVSYEREDGKRKSPFHRGNAAAASTVCNHNHPFNNLFQHPFISRLWLELCISTFNFQFEPIPPRPFFYY